MGRAVTAAAALVRSLFPTFIAPVHDLQQPRIFVGWRLPLPLRKYFIFIIGCFSLHSLFTSRAGVAPAGGGVPPALRRPPFGRVARGRPQLALTAAPPYGARSAPSGRAYGLPSALCYALQRGKAATPPLHGSLRSALLSRLALLAAFPNPSAHKKWCAARPSPPPRQHSLRSSLHGSGGFWSWSCVWLLNVARHKTTSCSVPRNSLARLGKFATPR